MRSSLRGWGVAALLCIPMVVFLAVQLPDLTLAGALLLLLCAVVIVAASTNIWVAIVTAVGAFLVTNWFLVPPYRTLFVASTDDVVVLTVFLASAVAASLAVTRVLAAQTRLATAAAEAGALRETVSTPMAEANPEEALTRIATLYRMSRVELLGAGGRVLVSAVQPIEGAEEPVEVDLSDGGRLRGWRMPAIGEDLALLTSLGQGAMRAYEARQLADDAARATELERDRSALLTAVGHDLRTPLAAISLAGAALSGDSELPADVRQELAQGIVTSAHTLDRLVTNLLDMSRLEAGRIVAQPGPVDLEPVCAAALMSLDNPDVRVELPVDLPLVTADAALLERVLANLVSNALRHGKPPVQVRAESGPVIRLQVIDHGSGLATDAVRDAFEPFTSAGDRAPVGLGLGLTIAGRFCQIMDLPLQAQTTPGGGLTMTIELEPVP